MERRDSRYGGGERFDHWAIAGVVIGGGVPTGLVFALEDVLPRRVPFRSCIM